MDKRENCLGFVRTATPVGPLANVSKYQRGGCKGYRPLCHYPPYMEDKGCKADANGGLGGVKNSDWGGEGLNRRPGTSRVE